MSEDAEPTMSAVVEKVCQRVLSYDADAWVGPSDARLLASAYLELKAHEQCDEYLGGYEWKPAHMRCVYHQGHKGPHWASGMKQWPWEPEDEIARVITLEASLAASEEREKVWSWLYAELEWWHV